MTRAAFFPTLISLIMILPTIRAGWDYELLHEFERPGTQPLADEFGHQAELYQLNFVRLPTIKLKLLEPLIVNCGVQFYFSGHEHQQEHLSAPEFEQVVQGAAAKLRPVREAPKRDPAVRQMAAESTYGFALMEVTAERLVLRFFGENGEKSMQQYHCRVFERADFGDHEQRSQDCPP